MLTNVDDGLEAQLLHLPPPWRPVARTVYFNWYNAELCRALLAEKLLKIEAALEEYRLKVPVLLEDLIRDYSQRATAIRIALRMPITLAGGG